MQYKQKETENKYMKEVKEQNEIISKLYSQIDEQRKVKKI